MRRNFKIWGLILFFGLIYGFFSIWRHLRLESFIFDLGVYDQQIWLISRFKLLYSSILGAHAWGDHFTPSLVLISPLYWVWDNVVILLVFQALVAVLGAYPIYVLTRKRLKSEWMGLLMAVAYLGFFGVQNAVGFDFHPIVLAATGLAFMLWFYEERKWKWFFITVALVLGLQENFFLTIAAWGGFLVMQYRDFKRGLLLGVVGVVGFLLVVLVVIPGLGRAEFTYLPRHWENWTVRDAAKMLIYPRSKVEVVVATMAAFGGLSLFSPAVWVFFLEEFLQRFLGTSIATRWSVGYQYNVILAPMAAWGAVLTMERFLKKRLWVGGVMIIAGMVVVQGLTHPALNVLLKRDFYNAGYMRVAGKVLAEIPDGASVAATNNLGAQLAHREGLIFLTNCVEDPRVWRVDMRRCFSLTADYLVADLRPEANPNSYYPDSREKIERYLNLVEEGKEYERVMSEGGFVLYKRVMK